MTTIDAYLVTLPGVLAAMALLSLVETWHPFFRAGARRRHHALPNLALTALTLGLNFAFNAAVVLVAAGLAGRGGGVLAGTALPPLAVVAIAIVVLDVSTYACHRLMHVWPALWRVHRVHHSDPLVDVTTALRFHPLETLWRFLFIVVPAGVLGLPAAAVAAYRVVSVGFGLLEHMNVRLWQPLDGALSWVVATPNMHKLHHSRRAREANTNYGNVFSLCDRLCGTFTPSSAAATVAYGLAGCDDLASQRCGALLRLPFRAGARAASSVVATPRPCAAPRGSS